MTTFFRPGPSRIPEGAAPHGVVLHVYGQDGRLLLERPIAPRSKAVELAPADAADVKRQLGPHEALCIVVFDGDSGERVTPLGTGLWVSP